MVTPKRKRLHFAWGRVILLAVILLMLYVIIPQLGSLKDARSVLAGTDFVQALIGVGLFAAILIVGAIVYQLLAFRPLPFWRTLAVQLAASFTGKLLPAGLGAAGLNAEYLASRKHTISQAVTVVALNNLLGVVGHIILLGMALLLIPGSIGELLSSRLGEGGNTIKGIIIALLAVGVVSVVLFSIRPLRQRINAFLAGVRKDLWAYRKRPGKTIAALVVSMILTLLYVGVLYVSQLALGFEATIVQTFVVITLGMLAGTATPTPGGVGGAEAGLAAGFVAYGFSFSDGLAIALLYRMIMYWLPLIPGGIAYLAIRRSL